MKDSKRIAQTPIMIAFHTKLWIGQLMEQISCGSRSGPNLVKSASGVVTPADLNLPPPLRFWHVLKRLIRSRL